MCRPAAARDPSKSSYATHRSTRTRLEPAAARDPSKSSYATRLGVDLITFLHSWTCDIFDSQLVVCTTIHMLLPP
jgi:hypothetical protein